MIRNFLFLLLCQRRISLWLIIFLISGCSTPKKIIISDALDAVPEVTGYVVNQTAFIKGGNLALNAFVAGTNAAADEQTDELSIMILKGISDALPKSSPQFKIVQKDQQQPDFLLEGNIEDYDQDAGPTHEKLHANQVYFSIDGNIWLHQTGERVFVFKSSSVIDLKTQSPNTVAYQMGEAIAQFIGSQKG